MSIGDIVTHGKSLYRVIGLYEEGGVRLAWIKRLTSWKTLTVFEHELRAAE